MLTFLACLRQTVGSLGVGTTARYLWCTFRPVPREASRWPNGILSVGPPHAPDLPPDLTPHLEEETRSGLPSRSHTEGVSTPARQPRPWEQAQFSSII